MHFQISHWLIFKLMLKLIPEAGTVTSFHCSTALCLHCRTKLVIGVPPVLGVVLREKRTEVGPGETVR